MNSKLTKLSPIVTVKSVSEPKEDKNGRTYKVLRLQGISESVEVIAGKKYNIRERGKEVSLTQHKESYLNGEPDPFWDAKEGETLGVEIWNAQGLKPYDIVDSETGETREATSYTFPVIRGDNPKTVMESSERYFADEEQEETLAHEMDEEEEEAPDIVAG